MLQAVALYAKNPNFGKVFIVVKSDDPNYNRLGEMFQRQDPDGKVRLVPDSIQAAINQTTSGEGDVILVGPGTYEENLVVALKDYVRIVGIGGSGYERPDVTPATGVALSVTTSQGFVAEHMRFVSEDADSVIQKGNGYKYDDCVFDGTAGQAATEGCFRLVGDIDDSYTASEGVVQNSLFRGSTSGAGIIFQYAPLPSGVGVTDVQLLNNRFYGNGVDLLSAINVSGGGAGIFLNLLVKGNYFMTVGAAYVYFDMNQGAAGDLAANSMLASDNYFADETVVAAQIAIDGQPNCMFVGNYDCAGLIDGTTFNN